MRLNNLVKYAVWKSADKLGWPIYQLISLHLGRELSIFGWNFVFKVTHSFQTKSLIVRDFTEGSFSLQETCRLNGKVKKVCFFFYCLLMFLKIMDCSGLKWLSVIRGAIKEGLKNRKTIMKKSTWIPSNTS